MKMTPNECFQKMTPNECFRMYGMNVPPSIQQVRIHNFQRCSTESFYMVFV